MNRLVKFIVLLLITNMIISTSSDAGLSIEGGLISVNATTDHDPIYIDGNTDLISIVTTEGWTGDGTENEPYIIKDYKIDTYDGVLDVSGINLRNTNLYVKISNMDISSAMFAGIDLNNVSNIEVTSSDLSDCGYGIKIYKSSSIMVEGVKSFENSNAGFDIFQSSNIEIFLHETNHNKINGILVAESTNIRIHDGDSNNNEGAGIRLSNSAQVEIINNNLLNNELEGISVLESQLVDIKDNILESNGAWGIYLSGIVDNSNHTVLGNTIRHHTLNGIKVHGTNDTLLKLNTVINSSIGIDVGIASTELQIIENTIATFILGGISLSFAHQCLVEGNIVSDSVLGSGIEITSTSDSDIKSNTVTLSGEGISSYASINNYFEGNTANENKGGGFIIAETYDSYYIKNTANNNGERGFSILDSGNITLVENSASGNADHNYYESNSIVTLENNEFEDDGGILEDLSFDISFAVLILPFIYLKRKK